VPDVWVNWAGDQRCAPRSIERPRSEREVVEAVERARGAGERVRVAGSGHSFTDIACTDGRLLHLGAMDGILDHDSESGLVRVQAGITLNALGRGLAERGLAMENQGDIDRQALAGALATATHGTGLGFRNLSARVERMRIVTADASVVEVDEESDAEAWRAARVSIGALGVVTEVTLRCVPLFTLRRVDHPRPLTDVLERYDELCESHDHFEFWLFPYADQAIFRETERLPDADPVPVSQRRLWFEERFLPNIAVSAGAQVGRMRPSAIPAINRAFMRIVTKAVRQDHSYRVYAGQRDIKFTEMEYAIPREHGLEALQRVLEVIQSRRLPVGLPLEMRIVAGDDAFLSTAHGRETVYIAVHQFRGMDFETYFRAVERIMTDYGGRPHWGKRHYRSAAELAPLYPDWERFQAVRARLDPEGVFTNEYVERVLGPAGAAVAAG